MEVLLKKIAKVWSPFNGWFAGKVVYKFENTKVIVIPTLTLTYLSHQNHLTESQNFFGAS